MSRELTENPTPRPPRPATWSFTPVGSALIALTDVLAMSGDSMGPVTYVALSIPLAMLGGAGVLLTEYLESRRVLLSMLKACVAAFLIVIPLPVGGLVGAGASLGHRALRKSEPS